MTGGDTMSYTCVFMQMLATKQIYLLHPLTICCLCGHRYSPPEDEDICPHCNVQITGDQYMLYFTVLHESEMSSGD